MVSRDLSIPTFAASERWTFAPILGVPMSEIASPSGQWNGLSLKQWKAAFRPGIEEFAASNFIYTGEDGAVRIAFGNRGPAVAEDGTREPVFTHALTISEGLAVELARLLLKRIAEPTPKA